MFSIPVIGFYDNVIDVLFFKSYNLRVYQIVIAILFVPLLYFVYLLLFKNEKKVFYKELLSLKIQLDNPFEIEQSNLRGTHKLINKYYHYEILECFEIYNDIALKLKKYNHKRFSNIKVRDDRPRIVKGDWVLITEMQVIKADVEKAIALLK